MSKGTIIERFVVESEESLEPELVIELNQLQWYLKWEKGDDQQSLSLSKFELTLQCVPIPEFASKVDGIMVLVAFYLSSSSGDESKLEIRMNWHAVTLSKQDKFQCTLLEVADSVVLPLISKGAEISLNEFGNSISIDTKVLLRQISLNGLDQVEIPDRDISQGIGAMLRFDSNKRSQFSDITLVASPKGDDSSAPVEFFTHKVILAATSPVFAKMLEHQMQESLNNRIEIKDIDSDVLKEMLVYIYTNQVPKMDEMANDLLYVTDKYQLDHLKALCELHLTCSLQINNASHIVQLAFTHNAPQLRKNALKFIAKNAAEVRATEEWEEVKQRNNILDELIETMQEPPAKRPKTD